MSEKEENYKIRITIIEPDGKEVIDGFGNLSFDETSYIYTKFIGSILHISTCQQEGTDLHGKKFKIE